MKSIRAFSSSPLLRSTSSIPPLRATSSSSASVPTMSASGLPSEPRSTTILCVAIGCRTSSAA